MRRTTPNLQRTGLLSDPSLPTEKSLPLRPPLPATLLQSCARSPLEGIPSNYRTRPLSYPPPACLAASSSRIAVPTRGPLEGSYLPTLGSNLLPSAYLLPLPPTTNLLRPPPRREKLTVPHYYIPTILLTAREPPLHRDGFQNHYSTTQPHSTQWDRFSGR